MVSSAGDEGGRPHFHRRPVGGDEDVARPGTNSVRKLGNPSTGCVSGMFCMFGLPQVLRPEIAPATL